MDQKISAKPLRGDISHHEDRKQRESIYRDKVVEVLK